MAQFVLFCIAERQTRWRAKKKDREEERKRGRGEIDIKDPSWTDERLILFVVVCLNSFSSPHLPLFYLSPFILLLLSLFIPILLISASLCLSLSSILSIPATYSLFILFLPIYDFTTRFSSIVAPFISDLIHFTFLLNLTHTPTPPPHNATNDCNSSDFA